jgi:hypothetical protein
VQRRIGPRKSTAKNQNAFVQWLSRLHTRLTWPEHLLNRVHLRLLSVVMHRLDERSNFSAP